MRLIDANELHKELTAMAVNAPKNHLRAYARCINALETAPTVDAEPVKYGYWKGESDGYADGFLIYDVWYCSACEYCIDDGTDDPEFLPKHCPGCGAKMDAKHL